ncbi:hypothetical protein CapIbe_024056 [Capra ibex]
MVITGLSKKPSLSAQGGPMLRSGENVTLVCSPESASDQLHLLRERGNLGRGPRRALQAEFPLGPGTPAHSGVCRSLGSFTRSPYSWSDSSDPLFLSVTGSPTSTCPSTMDPHTTEDVAITEGAPKEDRTVNDPPAEDVIFVHLNHRTLSEGLFTPTPLSPLHLFADTSLYKEFDVNQDHADPDLAPSFEHTECYQLKSYISF